MWPEHRIASARHQEVLREAERRRTVAAARRAGAQAAAPRGQREADGSRSLWARLTMLDPRKA
jgi:hypothetical protein